MGHFFHPPMCLVLSLENDSFESFERERERDRQTDRETERGGREREGIEKAEREREREPNMYFLLFDHIGRTYMSICAHGVALYP